MSPTLPFRHWPWQGFFFLLEKKEAKIQDWVNVTLKAFGFTKQLQAASLRGSVFNANPKAFLTLHRPRSSF
ncbi:hypothetical protein [Sphingobacterium pedocola]|uniref:Uncharacterized protein n=1 Tax=Sphingobacterium pedocola TaxID=2082722 RepID=A0ABR9TAI9_9SPHI|nr:hypothetical protein [Sphingobacterium pedocola]MBE8722067.1 hypothetical protein [Sphingobacterium pedocola]